MIIKRVRIPVVDAAVSVWEMKAVRKVIRTGNRTKGLPAALIGDRT